MTPITRHYQEVVTGAVGTHRAAHPRIRYNRGVREGRNFFLTESSDKVGELEGNGDLSIVKRWIMELRKEEAENELCDKAKEDQGLFLSDIVFPVRVVGLIKFRVVIEVEVGEGRPEHREIERGEAGREG